MKRIITLFIPLFFILNNIVFTQEIQYGVGGGITFVLAPGNYTSSIDTSGKNYGFTSNYHLGGKFKMILGNSPIKLDAYLYYTSFKGSENNVILQNTAVDFNTSTSLWTFGVGAEYHFMQKSLSPYAGIDIQFNNQNDVNFERDFASSTRTVSTSGWTRLGLALGGGVDISLLDQLTLDTALKFNFLNMFGQANGESSFDTFSITLNLLYSPNITVTK